MSTLSNYEILLENKLIEKFREEFYEKLGYYPTVITKTINKGQQEFKMMSLKELKTYFDPFLPVIYGKRTPLDSKSRKRELVELRHIFSYIARKMGFSLLTIGQFLNNRDHSTIINNLRVFDNLIQTDPDFREKYNIILQYIKTKKHEPPTLEPADHVQGNP